MGPVLSGRAISSCWLVSCTRTCLCAASAANEACSSLMMGRKGGKVVVSGLCSGGCRKMNEPARVRKKYGDRCGTLPQSAEMAPRCVRCLHGTTCENKMGLCIVSILQNTGHGSSSRSSSNLGNGPATIVGLCEQCFDQIDDLVDRELQTQFALQPQELNVR